MVAVRKGSYRWYLSRLSATWYARGIFDHQTKRFKVVDWHKPILLGMIAETRKLLDELEAKLRGTN